jgi:hypothetical protein
MRASPRRRPSAIKGARSGAQQTKSSFPDIPLPRVNCERWNRALKGRGWGNTGAQDGPIRPRPDGAGGLKKSGRDTDRALSRSS